jgi:reactive intermediate/imine deaminase
MDRKQIIDPGWSYHRVFGYSQAVRAGGLLFLAGQMPVDTEGHVVAAGDIHGQTRQTFENVKAVLAAAGASLDDIVDMTTYHTDMADLGAVMEVKGTYLTGDLPAWTAVGVPALALPGQMIEIKVVALARS